MQPPAPAIEGSEKESPELFRFREEWRAEVQKKKAPHSAASTGFTIGEPDTSYSNVDRALNGQTGPSSANRYSSDAAGPQAQPGPSTHTIAGIPSAITNSGVSGLLKSTPLSSGLGSAINLYRRAVQHEQRSELDDALLLYRQAFRMDPNVDRAYHRQEKFTSIFGVQQGPAMPGANEPQKRESVDQLANTLQQPLALKFNGPNEKFALVTGTLAGLVANFPGDAKFQSDDENQTLPLRRIPDELLVMILRRLDPTSLERFATVSRKARILTLESTIWRDLVTGIYKPPQVPDIESMVPVLEHYLSDFRRVYIEYPRVRTDGVYIAICHYVRPGLSENSWVNISHLITYHRYLRFFPNGQVLSLLANEEHSPQQVIPLLRPSLRMKGLFVGNWYLSGTTIHLSNLVDASGRFPLPHPHSHLSPLSSNNPIPTLTISTPSSAENHSRYVFVMTLGLRSRPLGRWNKLDIQSYDSVNLETGDSTPVALKHERPFWFSKVRSYTS